MEAWYRDGVCALEEQSLLLVLQQARLRAATRREPGPHRVSWLACQRIRATSVRGWQRALAKATIRALLALAQGHTFASAPSCGEETVWKWAERLALAYSRSDGAWRLLRRFPWLRPAVSSALLDPGHVLALRAIQPQHIMSLWDSGIPTLRGLDFPASATNIRVRWAALAARIVAPFGACSPRAYWSWASAMVGGASEVGAVC